MSAKISINGKTYTGESISIINGKISIDGTTFQVDDKIINISVNGDIQNAIIDSCEQITISGNAGDVRSISGDIQCANVTGNVTTTSGDINCKNIAGNVQTVSGDVEADEIKGNVKTLSGDITRLK